MVTWYGTDTLEGRNHKHKLDPALIRPGRADIEVEFKNATASIYRDLFKVFYPVDGQFPAVYARSGDMVQDAEKSKTPLTSVDIDVLAEEFALALPEGEFSAAQIQGKHANHLTMNNANRRTSSGMLMRHREYPGEAVDGVAAWVEEKRKEKAADEQKKYVRQTRCSIVLLKLPSRIEAADAKEKAKEGAQERKQRRQVEKQVRNEAPMTTMEVEGTSKLSPEKAQSHSVTEIWWR